MKRRILMNVADGDECRIAVLENNRLFEYFVDRPSQLKHVGNIYKAVINNIEPGIQAAFVDIGLERNGFLHVSDVNYAYENSPDVKGLFSRTMRVKDPVNEKDILEVTAEREVEEVTDFQQDNNITKGEAGDDSAVEAPEKDSDDTNEDGDGKPADDDASNGRSEPEYLDELDSEHPGHAVTDSPTSVARPEKLEMPALAASDSPESTKADGERTGKRRRRRRGRGRKSDQSPAKEGEGSASAPQAQAQPQASPEAPKADLPALPPPDTAPAASEADPEPKPEGGTEQAKGGDASESKGRSRRRRGRRGGAKRRKQNTDTAAKGNDGNGNDSNGAPKPPSDAEAKPEGGSLRPEDNGKDGPLPGPAWRFHRGPAPKLQNVLKRGQEVVVQVSKASQGGKGPGLTTFVSLPGRYMVLTPTNSRGGVSRKIEDGAARTALRKMLDRLPVPEGMGVIIRTAAINRSYDELLRDLNYLLRVWSVVVERIHEAKAPALLYSDSDPAIRTVRDYFTADTEEIVVDNREVYERVVAFFDQLMPSFRDRVKLYEDDVPMFFAEGIEGEIEHLFDKKVNLKSGGYLFIEQTEALISIDVNSGKFTSAGDAEKTAYLTNLEAIPEMCRQLRLRDLGGIVCCDFIDMLGARHRHDVENALRRELGKDRARTKVSRFSPFGVIEMTRQRVRPSIKAYTFVSCPTCGGFGMVRSAETMCLSLLRRMRMALCEDRVQELIVQVHPNVLSHLHSEFRADIDELEDRYEKQITFEYSRDLELGQTRFFYVNDRAARVLYDMDQRINSFAQGKGRRVSTNVATPLQASGGASPDSVAAKGDGSRRKSKRRGGRKQRERERERVEREERIKTEGEKAVTFGDTLAKAPDIEVVREKDEKKDSKQKSGRTQTARRTADAKGKPVRTAKSKATSAKSDSKQSEPKKATTTKSAKPTKTATGTATRKPAKAATKTTAKTAAKTATKKAATKATAKSGTKAKTATKKAVSTKAAGTKATPKKAAAKKPVVKKTPAKKATTKTTTKATTKPKATAKKTAAKTTTKKATTAKKTTTAKATTKKTAAKKPAAKKPAVKKAPAKKAAAAKKPAKKTAK
jgi:ribonuclease E